MKHIRMSLFTQNIVSKLSFAFILILGCLSPNLTTYAADFRADNVVNVTQTTENLYAAGNQVDIGQLVRKDLVAAGGTVYVRGNIERNIAISGGNVVISSQLVGGNARIAGGTVSINGSTITDDLVIFGGAVSLENVNVLGDLIVFTNSLNIKGSKISGDIYGRYSELQGDDLSNQVQGSINATIIEKNEQEEEKRRRGGNIFWPGEVSVIVALTVLSYFLWRRGRLVIPTIGLNSKIGWDLLWGFGVILLIPLTIFISIFLFLFPLITTISVILYAVLILTAVLFPIYFANLIRNTFKSSMDIRLSVALSYALLLGINVLVSTVPAFAFLSFLIFIVYIASYGFVVRTSLRAINTYITPYNSNSRPNGRKKATSDQTSG